MTKYDLVKQHDQYDSADNETISAENYKDVVKDIAAAFSIEGSLKDNMTQWTSYTDKTSSESDNPLIDNTALKLMRRIVAPSCPRTEETKAVVTTVTKMNLMFKKWLRKQNFTFTQLLLMTVLLFLAIIMFVLIKYPLF
ncbi:uncharacterized protein LOC123561142 [Mercenaria mercenaria]|uniref:uncharacterized protein LOC123561142 n=1 Tax=Mercenaria mercenaria TaxID=6596 RepID=UPI00234F9F20|nr:uncharacterized protein LOC123561142 [Mercenaria mercenaria]